MKKKAAVIAIGLVAAVLFVELTSDYYVFVVNLALLAAVGAVALNLLTGYAGQVSIGNAAFLAIGGWTCILANPVGFMPSVLMGGIVCAAVGFLVGIPSLRLRGLYLAMTTLALHFIIQFAFNQYQTAEKAYAGFPMPVASIGPLRLDTDKSWYVLLIVVLVITLLVSSSLLTTKPGRAWIAIREHDVAAALVGVNVTRYKLLSFTVSSFFIGLAGGLAAYYTRVVSADQYSLELAVSYVAMVIIGGLGSLFGAVIGAFIVSLLPLAVSNLGHSVFADLAIGDFVTRNLANLEMMIYGVLVLAFLYFEPGGIAGLFRRVVLRRRLVSEADDKVEAHPVG